MDVSMWNSIYTYFSSLYLSHIGKHYDEPLTLTEEDITECTQNLKEFYLQSLCNISADPMGLTHKFEFEQIYTNLSMLIEGGSGGIQKCPLDYSALLTTPVDGVMPKRFLVQGEGGAGKTTFCSKIAWDWTNGSRFQEFTMVLVIPLRDTEDDETVGQIVKRYLPDENRVQARQIDNYIRTNPDKVFIIFDGLDEYNGDLSLPHSNDIVQILRSDRWEHAQSLSPHALGKPIK